MTSNKHFREMALSLPETIELPHFEKTSFRINNKIFATLDENAKRVCIKLTAIDQDAFSLFDKSIIYPVPNKWGKNGWTFIELSLVNSATLLDALTAAYCTVAPNRLIRQIQK